MTWATQHCLASLVASWESLYASCTRDPSPGRRAAATSLRSYSDTVYRFSVVTAPRAPMAVLPAMLPCARVQHPAASTPRLQLSADMTDPKIATYGTTRRVAATESEIAQSCPRRCTIGLG